MTSMKRGTINMVYLVLQCWSSGNELWYSILECGTGLYCTTNDDAEDTDDADDGALVADNAADTVADDVYKAGYAITASYVSTVDDIGNVCDVADDEKWIHHDDIPCELCNRLVKLLLFLFCVYSQYYFS